MKIIQKTILERVIDDKKAEFLVDNDMPLPLIYQALLEMKELISKKLVEQEKEQKAQEEKKEEKKEEVKDEG